MLSNVVFIIAMNLALSFTPQIDLWGHLGGLAAGLVLAWLLGPHWKLEADPYTGNPSLVDFNPLSRRLPLAFFMILAFFAAVLWMAVR
jgi:xanthine/uracil permease